MTFSLRSLKCTLFAAAWFWANQAIATPFELSYSGRLTTETGQPLEGPIDVKLRFFRTESDGAPLVGAIDIAAVPMQQGILQIGLALPEADFHLVFDGVNEVFIEVEKSAPAPAKIYPRQRFNAVPYALKVPVDQQTIVYDNTGHLKLGTVNLSGDLSGTAGAAQVDKIQGKAVQATGANDGDFMKYDGATQTWKPGSVSGASGGTVTSVAAGAGLTGPTITGAGSLSIATAGVTDAMLAGSISDAKISSSANWNVAYTNRLRWDGGATSLVAATGRTSLGLGALATANAVSGGAAGTITDDTIVNADVNSAAAIATSKLAGPVTAIASNGLGSLATLSSIASSEITDGSIANVDVSGSAAIATSKLSGPVTSIASNGLGSLATLSSIAGSEIADGTIANVDVNASAAIATSKLSGAVTAIASNGLGSLATASAVAGGAGGTITDDTITNADINSSAAIAVTKIAAGTANQVLTTNGTINSWQNPAFFAQLCSAGQYLQGFDASGNKVCVTIATTPTFAKAGTHGLYHHCGILSDKTVECWGYNAYGELGDGSLVAKSTPVFARNPNGTKMTSVESTAGGNEFNCFSKTNGTVWCVGYNGYGQLGNGTIVDSIDPVQVTGISTAVSVTAGIDHACALLADATVSCWGLNNGGQLGDATLVSKSSPVAVSGLTGVTQVSAGDFSTCAVKSNNTVWCWGYNNFGQLGNNSTTDSKVPVQVTATSLTAATKVSISSSISSNVTYTHACAVKTDNTVWCWGYNAQGQLGNISTVNSSVPVQVKLPSTSNLTGVSDVRVGGFMSCALMSDGTAKCWGYDGTGELCDDNTATNKTSATTVQDFGGGGTMTNIVDIGLTATDTATLLFIRSDGTAGTCGYGANGQLGNNGTTSSYLPQGVWSP